MNVIYPGNDPDIADNMVSDLASEGWDGRPL